MTKDFFFYFSGEELEVYSHRRCFRYLKLYLLTLNGIVRQTANILKKKMTLLKK